MPLVSESVFLVSGVQMGGVGSGATAGGFITVPWAIPLALLPQTVFIKPRTQAAAVAGLKHDFSTVTAYDTGETRISASNDVTGGTVIFDVLIVFPNTRIFGDDASGLNTDFAGTFPGGTISASSAPLNITGLTADEAVATGALVSSLNGATGTVVNANLSAIGLRANAFGFCVAGVSAGDPIEVQDGRDIIVPDLRWDGGVPVAADIGKEVYGATVNGKVTLTAPGAPAGAKTVGTVLYADGVADTTRVAIRLGDTIF